MNALDDLTTKAKHTATRLMNNNAVRSPDCNVQVYIHKCLLPSQQTASMQASLLLDVSIQTLFFRLMIACFIRKQQLVVRTMNPLRTF